MTKPPRTVYDVLRENPAASEFLSFNWLHPERVVDEEEWLTPDGVERFLTEVVQWQGDEGPAPYQIEIARDLMQYHRVAARGPHGIGKTALSAWLVWFFLWAVPGDLKVVTTASAWRQLIHFLWPEIHSWRTRIPFESYGMLVRDNKELLQLNIQLPPNKYAFAVASDQPTLVEGAHAKTLLYVVDEAKSVPDELWDAIEGAFSTGNCVVGDTEVSAFSPEFVTRRWYEGAVISIQTVAGHSLTITPNHPVLTTRGWVRAQGLQEGDQVIACRDAQSLMMRIKPNAVQIPTRIKDVFETNSMLNLAVARASDVLTAKNIYGTIPNDKVDIETPNGLLGNWRQSCFNQFLINPCLIDTPDKSLFFSRLSAFLKASRGFTCSTSRVSGARGSESSLDWIFSDVDPLSGYNIACGNPIFHQTFMNNRLAYSEVPCQFPYRFPGNIISDKLFAVQRYPFRVSAEHPPRDIPTALEIQNNSAGTDIELQSKLDTAFPGQIFADQIIHLGWRQFSGHVYDLQTKNHWFTANDSSTNSESITGRGGIIVHNCYAFAISTPGDPAGRFYDIHQRKPGYEDWKTRHVTLAEALAAGRISAEWAEQRRKQWETSSPQMYQNRVLGNFYASSERSVIPMAWVEAAIERWYTLKEAGEFDKNRHVVPDFGLDVAEGVGRDASALAMLRMYWIEWVKYYDDLDVMQLTGEVVNAVKLFPPTVVGVDTVGVGVGPFRRLRELGIKASSIKAGAKCEFKDASGQLTFVNLRAGMWWTLRDRLDPFQTPNAPPMLALPPDDRLISDLTSPMYETKSDGKILIESKESLRERLGRSPDGADAVLLALFARRMLREFIMV